MAMSITSYNDAAAYTMSDYPGAWTGGIVQCTQCGELETMLLKCRRRLKGRCKRLPVTHVHHVCMTCGFVWLTPTWRV